MIINIRGTSGSGKTHLVREIMKLYPERVIFKREGRKQPLGYMFHRPNGRSLAVIGHYETACGGCDTINLMDDIFDLVRQSAQQGCDVIFEGLLISAEVNRHLELKEWCLENDQRMLVVALTTPIEECLASVNARRAARNPDLPPVKEKNTRSKYGGVIKSIDRLRQGGVSVFEGNRAEAFDAIKEALAI